MRMIDDHRVYYLIGQKIKEQRSIAGFLQADLAEAIDVSRASLANYESGNTSIYISDLYLIADHLGKNINEFLPSIEEIKAAQPDKRLDKDVELDKLDKNKKKEIMDFINTLNNKGGENG